jgi:hypothetical protein
MATCPFCGVAAETPHETQEQCIDALHAEIARMRAILGLVQPAEVPAPPEEEEPTEGSHPKR